MMNLAEDVLGQILTAVIWINITWSVIQFESLCETSSHHHNLNRALKSPSINKNVDFSCLTWFKSFSKFTRKSSNSVTD